MKYLIITLSFLSILVTSCAQNEKATATANELGITELSASQFKEYIDEGGMIVVDVRTPAEFADGHIAGAMNVDFTDANFSLKLEEMDKNKSYLMHCQSGARSARALKIFKSNGFKNVGHLTQGFQEWVQNGYPVVQ